MESTRIYEELQTKDGGFGGIVYAIDATTGKVSLIDENGIRATFLRSDLVKGKQWMPEHEKVELLASYRLTP